MDVNGARALATGAVVGIGLVVAAAMVVLFVVAVRLLAQTDVDGYPTGGRARIVAVVSLLALTFASGAGVYLVSRG